MGAVGLDGSRWGTLGRCAVYRLSWRGSFGNKGHIRVVVYDFSLQIRQNICVYHGKDRFFKVNIVVEALVDSFLAGFLVAEG